MSKLSVILRFPARFCLALAIVGAGAAYAGELRMATTTSTENSGLLKVLLPKFEAATGVHVQVIAVGTGKAVKLGEAGDVDVVLVHARQLEDAFVASGGGIDRRDVMYNDFILVGPSADPAHVREQQCHPGHGGHRRRRREVRLARRPFRHRCHGAALLEDCRHRPQG